MPAPGAFTEWLWKQNKRRDPVGDLARDSLEDMDWPAEATTYEVYLEYLPDYPPAHDALKCAWAEWSPVSAKYGHNRAELETRFTYHAPEGGQPGKYTEVRDAALELADLLDALVPESREKALAFTKLEEMVMWANAGIARRS